MKMLALMPKPQGAPTANGSNYQTFLSPPVNCWELRLRGDYNISTNTKLFFSWNHQIEHDQNPISIWWHLNGSLPYPSSQDANQNSNVYSANLLHVFSPTLTNEFVFADATFLNPIILANPSAVDPTALGFKMTGLFTNPDLPMMPNTYGWGTQSQGVVGFGTYQYGEPFTPGGKNSFGKLSQTPQISDNVTKIAGAHTLKAGVYWDFARNYQTSGNLSQGTNGAANFDIWGSSTINTGNYLANFVSGRTNGFAQNNAEVVQDMKYKQYSFFVNDQWKASRRLVRDSSRHLCAADLRFRWALSNSAGWRHHDGRVLSHACHFHDRARAQRVRQFVALDDAQAKLAFGGLRGGFGDLGGRIRALIEQYPRAAAQGGGKQRRGAVQRGHGARRDDGRAVRVQPLLGPLGAHFDI
jgi:hypothetical protein